MTIQINVDKAKDIGNELRRRIRSEKFAPYDQIIAINIPGKDAERELAEQERVKIRQLDTQIQNQIQLAKTPEEIKEALNQFNEVTE